MPSMSRVEAAFCRSSPWTRFASTRILPWALQGQNFTGEVLEIGGGSGAMARAVLQRWPHIRITVTDYDPAMIETAGRRLAACDARVAVQVADATMLPFPSGSFDAVLSFLMLHHTLRWEQVLAEAARVLRPGGTLVGYDLLNTAANRWLHRLDRSPHRLVSMPELQTAFQQGIWTNRRTRSSGAGLTAQFAAQRTNLRAHPA